MRNSIPDVSKPEAPKPVENKDALKLDEEEEQIWESMTIVNDKITKKKASGFPSDKSKRQKVEVSVIKFNKI